MSESLLGGGKGLISILDFGGLRTEIWNSIVNWVSRFLARWRPGEEWLSRFGDLDGLHVVN